MLLDIDNIIKIQIELSYNKHVCAIFHEMSYVGLYLPLNGPLFFWLLVELSFAVPEVLSEFPTLRCFTGILLSAKNDFYDWIEYLCVKGV